MVKLLLNSTTQEEAAILGLDYIQDLLARYRVTQPLLMDNGRLSQAGYDDTEVRRILRAKVVDLYFQTLRFQFALMKQFAHGTMLRVLRDVFGLEHWNQMLQEVQETEAAIQRELKVSYQACLPDTQTTT